MEIEETQDGNIPLFLKKFNKVLSKDRIRDCMWLFCSTTMWSRTSISSYFLAIPALLQDAFDKADKWGNDGKNGRIDPFIDVYDVSPLYSTGVWDRYEFTLSRSFFLLSSVSQFATTWQRTKRISRRSKSCSKPSRPVPPPPLCSCPGSPAPRGRQENRPRPNFSPCSTPTLRPGGTRSPLMMELTF